MSLVAAFHLLRALVICFIMCSFVHGSSISEMVSLDPIPASHNLSVYSVASSFLHLWKMKSCCLLSRTLGLLVAPLTPLLRLSMTASLPLFCPIGKNNCAGTRVRPSLRVSVEYSITRAPHCSNEMLRVIGHAYLSWTVTIYHKRRVFEVGLLRRLLSFSDKYLPGPRASLSRGRGAGCC